VARGSLLNYGRTDRGQGQPGNRWRCAGQCGTSTISMITTSRPRNSRVTPGCPTVPPEDQQKSFRFSERRPRKIRVINRRLPSTLLTPASVSLYDFPQARPPDSSKSTRSLPAVDFRHVAARSEASERCIFSEGGAHRSRRANRPQKRALVDAGIETNGNRKHKSASTKRTSPLRPTAASYASFPASRGWA